MKARLKLKRRRFSQSKKGDAGMNREILFLGATLIAAVLIYVFPPVLSLCAAIVTFFCIGYAVYDARYTLQSVERQCFVIAAVAALVGTVLPEIRSSLWFVAGIMLLRFIMQHFFAKDPEKTVAEQKETITLLEKELAEWKSYIPRKDVENALRAEIERLQEVQESYVPKEEMDRKIAELKKFSNDTYEMQLRTVQEEMQEKLHVAEVRSAATVEEKETEKQRIIAQHHKLIQQMKSERNNALAEVTQNYETMIRAKNEEITALRSKLSAREEDLRAANARIETLNADITAFSARSRKEAEDLSYVEKEQYVEELMKLQTMLAQLEREKTAQDRYTAELEELIQSQDAKTEQERAAHEAELQKLRDERADSDAKLAKTRQSLAQASKDKEEIESLYLESKKKLEEMRKDVDYRTDETRTDILETLDILKVFRESVQNAKAELNIFSPWLNDDVIYKTSFKTDIEKLLKAGVKVKIRYGIGEEGEKKKNQKDDWKQRRSEEIAKELKQAFQKYRHFSMFRDNAHAKLFICDDEYYVITSFNVLSYHPRKKDTRREIGEMSRNLENLREYRQMYFSDEDFR